MAERERNFVQILATVVEAKLAFFEVRVEDARVRSSEPRRP